MSLFQNIDGAQADNAFAMIEAFRVDPSEKKVNLSPGIYRDESAKTWVLPSVKKAREILVGDDNLNHDISPQMGHPGFLNAAREIAFAETLNKRNVISMQTIAGTGANHLIARFLADVHKPRTVWLSNPSWENHTKIWTHVDPNIQQQHYPYFNYETFTLDTDGVVSTLRQNAAKGDVIVLQACAHNPTGLDPSKEQWQAIAEICEEKGLFAIFDMAYQGFATGNLLNDGWAIRHFAERSNGNMEFAVAQSFSKNFGFYGERLGALHVVTQNQDAADRVAGVLKKIARAEVTSTPAFGAKVVSKIFELPELRAQWQQDLDTMSGRLRDMRRRLFEELVKRETPGSWDHILTDIGMFSMLGLSPDQAVTLREQYHVYLLPTGRISFTGLTHGNVEYVADSIHRTITAAAQV